MGRPPKKSAKKKIKKRPDGRRLTSLFIQPKLMDALKKTAIDEKRSVYEIVEEAAMTYLSSRH